MDKKIEMLVEISEAIGTLDISITGTTKVGARLGAYIYNNYGDGFTKDYELNEQGFGFYLTLYGLELKDALEEMASLFKNRRGIKIEASFFGEYGIETIDFI